MSVCSRRNRLVKDLRPLLIVIENTLSKKVIKMSGSFFGNPLYVSFMRKTLICIKITYYMVCIGILYQKYLDARCPLQHAEALLPSHSARSAHVHERRTLIIAPNMLHGREWLPDVIKFGPLVCYRSLKKISDLVTVHAI